MQVDALFCVAGLGTFLVMRPLAQGDWLANLRKLAMHAHIAIAFSCLSQHIQP